MATESNNRHYTAAPIVEAIIELRLGTPLSSRAMKQAAKKIITGYDHKTDLKTRSVEVNIQEAIANFKEPSDIIKISSKDETETITLSQNSIAFSQLAPYKDWGSFFGRFTDDWISAKKIFDTLKFSRIGLRYVNRIDHLNDEIQGYPSKYLGISLRTTEHFKDLKHVALMLQADYGPRPLRLILNSSFAESPIPNKKAMIFDIDVIEETNPPQNFDEVCALLNEMRDIKNEIFEEVITEYARKQFNQ